MMNYDFDVFQELESDELQKTDGGFLFCAICLAALIAMGVKAL